MFIPVDTWFRAFLITVAVEAPLATLLLRRCEPRLPRLLLLILFANLASHPAVWFIFTQLLLVGTPEYLLVAETWAIACEAVFYWAAVRDVPVRRAIVTSLVANLGSFLVGLIMTAGWPSLS